MLNQNVRRTLGRRNISVNIINEELSFHCSLSNYLIKFSTISSFVPSFFLSFSSSFLIWFLPSIYLCIYVHTYLCIYLFMYRSIYRSTFLLYFLYFLRHDCRTFFWRGRSTARDKGCFFFLSLYALLRGMKMKKMKMGMKMKI